MSLLQELDEYDRNIMTNYIYKYGAGDHFIGLDEWLKYWDHSKARLYKLLGNKLIYRIPYSHMKSNDILKYEIREHLLSMRFKRIYHLFFVDFISPWLDNKIINKDTYEAFSSITDWENFVTNSITKGIKMKKPESRKMLQIQKGMKPVKALQKIMEYFPDEFQEIINKHFSFNEDDGFIHMAENTDNKINYKKEFEEFRLRHSMIYNDKKIEGNLCISIHPMDFMTMSDNASDWSSCMSWTDEGCYRVGSVEMMNSNNVLCCYLESSKPYTFDNNTEVFEWNNKKWRTLVYFTNDIIMSGKAYPYVSDDMSKLLLTEIRKLAEKNLHRTYSFGIEEYKDMIHINNLYDMNRNYEWMNYSSKPKYNIIWDTRGMYNDMLNDSKITYWCYRNKVKHKKIYNVSGKAPCLCCGDTVIEYDDDDDDYNDRYSNVGTLICYSCETHYTCDCCKDVILKGKMILAGDYQYCEKCFKDYIRKCPCCGRPIDTDILKPVGYYKNKKASFTKPNIINYIQFYDNDCDFESCFEAVYVCRDCKQKIKNKFKHTYSKLGHQWIDNPGYLIFYSDENFEPYRQKNLEYVDPDTDEEILS